jgi:hypothetical protein
VTGDDPSHEQTPTGQFAAAIQLQLPQEKEMTHSIGFSGKPMAS